MNKTEKSFLDRIYQEWLLLLDRYSKLMNDVKENIIRRHNTYNNDDSNYIIKAMIRSIVIRYYKDYFNRHPQRRSVYKWTDILINYLDKMDRLNKLKKIKSKIEKPI